MIDQPDREIVTFLNSRVQKHVPSITRFTTSICQAVESEAKHIGSGVLFRLGEERFLFTAAHVADRSDQGPIHIAASDHPVELLGTKAVTKPPVAGRDDDRLDVAIIHMASGTATHFADEEFITTSDLVDLSDPLHDDYFLVAGYPTSKQRFPRRSDTIEAYLNPFVAMSSTPDAYARLGLDPGIHQVLGFRKREMWRPDLGQVTSPDLYGMSGCGVWWLEGFDDEVLSAPKLSAILIEWRLDNHRDLLATRVETVLAGIWNSQPGLRHLLP